MQLEDDFKQAAREAILDDVEAEFKRDGGLLDQAIERSHEVLQAYGSENDYNVGPIIESLQEPRVERRKGRIVATWGWEQEASVYFELGTSDHVVDGNPILSFVWESPPAWVKQEFEPEGDGYRVFFAKTEPSGIPESRFVREGLEHLRRVMQ